MPITHSPETVELEAVELGDPEILAIGRLVRSCALIEDACHSYLSFVTKAATATITILLGQLGISKKLSLAQNFAKIRGPEEQETYAKLFDPERLAEVLRCRNAVVHGFLLGRWPSGKWAFETTTTTGGDEADTVSVTVISLSSNDLRAYAVWAADIASKASAHPYVVAQRKARQSTPLQPSRKNQQKKRQGGSPPPPPEPYRE